MFPFRYGRRNSCGHQPPGFITGPGYQALLSFFCCVHPPRGHRHAGAWVLGVVICSGREHRQVSRCGFSKVSVRQALGLLVPVGWALLLYTSGLSTQCSAGGLTHLRGGKPHLETCFPLRCIQRLSLPNVANQPCPWRDNWHTRGSSIPVLSY